MATTKSRCTLTRLMALVLAFAMLIGSVVLWSDVNAQALTQERVRAVGETFTDSTGITWRVLHTDGNGNQLILSEEVWETPVPYVFPHEASPWRIFPHSNLRAVLDRVELAPELAARALWPEGIETDVRTRLEPILGPGPFYDPNENEAVGRTTAGLPASARNPQEALFVLSISEANEYFADDEARQAPGGETWWLRSPGIIGISSTTLVDGDGVIGMSSVWNPLFYLRPALWVNRSDNGGPEMVTVTFAPGANGTLAGGTPNVTIRVPVGTAIPAADIPAVTANAGYRFTGWTPNDPAGHVVNTPITFTAQYEVFVPPVGDVTVTFAPGASGRLAGGTPNVTTRVPSGTPIPATAVPAVTPNAGYRHIGWTPNAPAGHVVTEDMTFTAQYEPIIRPDDPIEVTFAPGANGRLAGGTPNVVIEVMPGAAIPAASVPAVTPNNGFRFVGWAPHSAAGHVVNAPITFTAQYEVFQPVGNVTVTFAPGANGTLVGGTPNLTITIPAGTPIPAASIPNVAPNAGFRHIGWSPNAPAGHVVHTSMTFTAQYALGCNTPGCECDPCLCTNNDCGPCDAPGCDCADCTCINDECRDCNDCCGMPGCDCDDCACVDGECQPCTCGVECTCEDCACVDGDCVCPERHLGYMIGDDRNHFRPAANITRAEVATILARTQPELMNFEQNVRRLPPGMTTFTAFSDVTPSNWFFFYVAWAYDAGLVQGYGGRFRPNDPVTRQELAAMIARLGTVYAEGEASFPDANAASDWAAPYVYTVFRRGLMRGDTAGFFQPQRNITRAETATTMNRLLGRMDSREAFEAAEVIGLENMRPFPDLRIAAWYFPSVLAAANDHYVTRDADGAINWKHIPHQR